MKSTFEPGPGRRWAWADRIAVDTHADLMTAYYAGWFLDLDPNDPSATREGREEQQFPDDTLKAAEGFPGDLSGPEKAESTVWQVFAYEHFFRFETANRVWPPLVPASYSRKQSFAPGAPPATFEVLSYRRDYDAPGWHIRRGREQLTQTCGGTYHECADGVTQPHNHYTPTV